MTDNSVLRVRAVASHVTSLGPGRRFVVWAQGCPRRCPGCIAPETQPLDGGRLMPVKALAERIARSGDPGITLSGGEPFLQCEPLCALLDAVRAVRDMGVIAYTGYTLEELRDMRDPAVDALLDRVDVLIDGPYVEALNDDLGLRGSSNQRCIFLTNRYRDAMPEFGRQGSRVTEYRIWDERFLMIGVPTRNALHQLRSERKDGADP